MRHCHQEQDLYLVDGNIGIRRAALNFKIEKSTVFVDKNPASQHEDWHALSGGLHSDGI